MTRRVLLMALALGVAVLGLARPGTLFSFVPLPADNPSASSLLAGNSDVSVSVTQFSPPNGIALNTPVNFTPSFLLENNGPDADELVIVKTLDVPVGCTGSIDGSLIVTGSDVAVSLASLPVMNSGGNDSAPDSVTIECSVSALHTFTYRIELQPLFNTDGSQGDNMLTLPFTVCDTTAGGGDADGDGVTNATEVINGTNPCAADTDNDGINDGPDNCGNVANPSQTNSDTGPPPPASNTGKVGNGPALPGDATVPNGDGLGDACDDDLDNDGLTNVEDGNILSGCGAFNGAAANHPSPSSGDITYNDNLDLVMMGVGDNGPSWDTDGDGVRDGMECDLGTNPRVAAAGDLVTCRSFFGLSDADADAIEAAGERCKWGTSSGSTNTDGDALGDCKEIMDVNGNSAVQLADSTLVLQAVFGIIGLDGGFDVNGNGQVSVADSTLIKQAVFSILVCP